MPAGDWGYLQPPPSGTSQGAWENTPLGKILRLLGTGERYGTKYVLKPAAELLFPEAEARLKALQGDTYAGDIVQAVSPQKDLTPSPWSSLGRTAASVGLGMAVDPLSYLRVGALTGLGRKAAQAGSLAEQASGQARLGQKALLSASIPFSKKTLPLVKGEKVYRALEAVQSGHGLEMAARSAASHAGVLNTVRLPQMASFMDNLMTGFSQKFGFQVGADPWLMRTMQRLFSQITGGNKLRAEEIVDTLEPALSETARRFSVRLGIDEADALAKTKAASIEALDAHPTIVLGRTAKTFVQVPYRTEWDRSRDAIINNFGLPATWGGPASPTDTDLIRSIRDIAIKRERINSAILAQDEARLGKEMALVTHPDAGYSAGITSQNTRDWMRNYKYTSLQPGIVGKKGFATPPSSHIVYELRRSARVIDPQVLEEMKQADILKPFAMTVSYKGKKSVRMIDPEKWLRRDALRPVSRKTLRLINHMVKAKVLSLDRTAPNYVGKLAPAIPRMDFNRWVWEHGWGPIPTRTIPNFFDPDPTLIDIQRGMASDRAVLSKEWFDAVKARGVADPSQPRLAIHKKEKDALGNPVPIPADWVETNIPELKGYFVRSDDAKFLARYYEADINLGPSLKKFMHVFHLANQGFKAWALSIFPAYHTRNLVGALWNYSLGYDNAIEGAANLKRSASAWKAIRARGEVAKGWSLKGSLNPKTGKEWTAQEIWQAVQKENGWGVGFISEEPRELQRTVEYLKRHGPDDPERLLIAQARKDWKAAGKKGSPFVGPPPPDVAERIYLNLIGQNDWIETGFRIGSYIDDRIRMAHVIQRLREGVPVDEAIRSMKKYFFDYHQLAPFEKQWAKEAIPFYAWSRKNIPLQLESLIRRPDRIARLGSALQGWEAQGYAPPEEKILNEWMLKNFPLRIRKNKNGKYEYFIFKNWLPLADIQDLFHMSDWFVQGLTPFARIPIEQIANENFFTDRKIDYLNSVLHGERTYFGTLKGVGANLPGVGVPNRLAHLLKSFRLTNMLHTLIDNPQDLDIASQAMRTVAGRTYPLDVGRSQYQLLKQFEELKVNTRRAVRSAEFAGKREDALRLVQEYMRQRNKALQQRGL